jgi:hypothetical protein
MELSALGKMILFIGLTLTAFGLLLVFAPKLPWLGRLPGDFSLQTGSLKIYAPLATCLILSLLITLILNIFSIRK